MKHKKIEIPDHIQFDELYRYTEAIRAAAAEGTVEIDLSKTQWVHSSFLGFLINLKGNLQSKGGSMILHLSEPVKKIFMLTDLHYYFASEIAAGEDLSRTA